MKFVRFGQRDQEKPGFLDPQGGIRDISAYVTDINPISLSDPYTLQQFEKFDWTALPLVDSQTRIGVCVGSIAQQLRVDWRTNVQKI